MQPEGHQTATGNFNNLESDSWQITDGMARSTESSDHDLVVLVDQRHTTILGNVCGDSLVVLLKLDSDALSDSGVWLLGLNCDLFDNDAGGMRSASKWLLPLGATVLLLVAKIGPSRKCVSSVSKLTSPIFS